MRLLIGGTGASLVGLWWLFDGLSGGPWNGIMGGVIWKGALLFLVGGAALVVGYRMLLADSPPADTPAPARTYYTERMTIGGIGVEKIYVFANGREATLQEMLLVLGYPGCKLDGGKNSGVQSATEEWRAMPGESDADALQRIARETADKHPSLAVLAFFWPDTYPQIIAAYVTETEFPCPFGYLKPIARAGGSSTAIQPV